MSDAETRQCVRMGGDNRLQRPSFHSLISTNGNLVLTLRTAAAVGLPNDLNEPLLPQRPHSQSIPDMDVHLSDRAIHLSDRSIHLSDRAIHLSDRSIHLSDRAIHLSDRSIHLSDRAIHLSDRAFHLSDRSIHLSDRAIRSRFEGVLIEAGILSPTNNFSNNFSSTDFKTLNILLEATPMSGVSHSELRQCLTTVEKMRMNVITKSSVRRSSSVGSIKIQNNPSSIPLFTISNSASYFDSIFESVHAFSHEVYEVVSKMRTKQEITVAKRISVRDADITAKEHWWAVRQGLIHPKAPWHFPLLYPK